MIKDNQASVEELGRLRATAFRRLDLLEQQAAAGAKSSTLQLPVVDGAVTPTYTTGKKNHRVRVALGFASFGNAADLQAALLDRSVVLTEDDYFNKRFHARLADKIDDNAVAAQTIVTQLDVDLDWNTPYDIITLTSLDASGGERLKNPQTPPLSADYPGNVLFSFTTPEEPGVGQAGGPNIIIGGGFMCSLDQYNVLDSGGAPVVADQKYPGRRWEVLVNSGVRIDRLAPGGGGSWDTDGIQWVDNGAVLACSMNMQSLGGQPATRIGRRIIPGETYTFSCLVAADGPDTSKKLFAALYDQGIPGDIVLEVTPDNWSFSTIPDWELFVAILRVPTSYVMSGKQWVRWGITGTIAEDFFTTKWKLERGENISPWTPHQGDEDMLDSQGPITGDFGHGGFGQTTGGIFDKAGSIFGGPIGLTAGKYIR